jgi:hypothetical protein
MSILAATGPSTYWYVTRSTGVVALLLLTAATALGVATSTRSTTRRWPRFVVSGLHRNLTLLAVAFVAAHVLTTVADGYAPIGLRDAVVPFLSPYRPVWLGLGAVAFDLLLALVATSLLRARLGVRVWRSVHWLAYATWPVAVVHSLGTGTDARSGWLRLVGLASLAVVAAAVLWRLASARAPGPRGRVAGALAAVVVPIAIVAWYQTGPLRPGWAARAGTPSALLASSTPVSAAPASVAAPQPFAGRLVGRINETSPDSAGLVTVAVDATLPSSGGALRLRLMGSPLEGGGVAMSSSDVRFARGGDAFAGRIVGLDGPRVDALVRDATGGELVLQMVLRADLARGRVAGFLQGKPPARLEPSERLDG